MKPLFRSGMKPLIPSRIAEIIFALVFIVFGILHFKNAGAMGHGVPSYMPGDGKIYIYLTGAVMILAGIGIIMVFHKTLLCYLLAAVLIIFVLAVHLKPAMDGNLTNFLKDTAMAMGAIIIGNRK